MNSFDFSMYDYDDVSEVKPVSKAISKKEIEPEEYIPFDFSLYDTEELPEQKQNNLPKQTTLEPELSELIPEGFTKGLMSGLSMGYSEKEPQFKIQEDETGSTTGHLIGAALPITGASKIAGYGLKYIPRFASAGLNALAHSFATGTTYGAGLEAVKGLKGEEISPANIPMMGVEFGVINSLFRYAPELVKRFIKIDPKNQAEILETGLIPKDLPRSQYETANEMIKLIKSPEFKQTGAAGLKIPESPTGGVSLANRQLSNPRDIGLRPTPQRTRQNLLDQVGDIFSENRFYNTRQGGQAIRNEIVNLDNQVYQEVNDLYARSRELNSQIIAPQPQLAQQLQNRIAQIETIPDPSTVQRKLLRTSRNILSELVERDVEGNIIGYRPINNQTLQDQVQSIRQIIDYDFEHGDANNIFRPIINDIQQAAITTAETVNPQAAQALNEARTAYRMWAEAFDNDYVRPWRNTSNQDLSKLFKSASDIDEANMLNRILSTSPQGNQLLQANKREMINKKLGKFFEEPRKANMTDFETAVRELEAVISPQEAEQVRAKMIQARNKSSIRAKKTEPRKLTNDEKIAAKYLDKKPEYIQEKMNSRSGIRELREDFATNKARKEAFDRLSKQKVRSLLREGNVEPTATGDDLYKFLNKEKNYELLSELIGEEETEGLRQVAKEIGKEEIKTATKQKSRKKIFEKVAIYKTLSLVSDLL